MTTCMICNKTSDTLFKLSKHITNTHKIKIKAYYDSYIACDGAGKCVYCGKHTSFAGLVNGYNRSCSKCKSNAARDMRDNLKKDHNKFTEFRTKVSNNQKHIWETRKLNGTASDIHVKTGSTIRNNNANLTTQQLKDKYGWQNKLTADELEVWKRDVMLNTGCHAWWKTATDEQKSDVVKKRISTMIQTEIMLVDQYMINTTDQNKYYQAVSYITEMNYHRYKSIIDPYSQRGNDYHLDHKFSIKAGYINKISPSVIGHYQNLQLLEADQNLKKNAKCSITLEELMESIDVKI